MTRDPRTTPRAGDIVRIETDHFGRTMVCEVVAVDRYGVKYKANGVLQSSCDVRAWQQWAMTATVTHKAES